MIQSEKQEQGGRAQSRNNEADAPHHAAKQEAPEIRTKRNGVDLPEEQQKAQHEGKTGHHSEIRGRTPPFLSRIPPKLRNGADNKSDEGAGDCLAVLLQQPSGEARQADEADTGAE